MTSPRFFALVLAVILALVPSIQAVNNRTYVPIGAVCRPKNSDGYKIYSGEGDTPESCQTKCEADADRCGAYEFENHEFDNRECELHEKAVISVETTREMGDCEVDVETNYRCCWIWQDIVDNTDVAAVPGEVEAANETANGVTEEMSSTEAFSSAAKSLLLLIVGLWAVV